MLRTKGIFQKMNRAGSTKSCGAGRNSLFMKSIHSLEAVASLGHKKAAFTLSVRINATFLTVFSLCRLRPLHRFLHLRQHRAKPGLILTPAADPLRIPGAGQTAAPAHGNLQLLHDPRAKRLVHGPPAAVNRPAGAKRFAQAAVGAAPRIKQRLANPVLLRLFKRPRGTEITAYPAADT